MYTLRLQTEIARIRYNYVMNTIKFDDSIYDTIRKNIKRYRKQKNMTAMQLSEMIDVSHEFIRQIESEKYERNYSVRTLYMISCALEITMNDLFEKQTDEDENKK